MSEEILNDPVEKLEIGVAKIKVKLEGMELAVNRMDSADRLVFHDQLAVLGQRQRTLAERLKKLRRVDRATDRRELQSALEGELQELKTVVGQVKSRVPRVC